MKNRINKVVTITLILFAVAFILPISNSNLLMTKAFAATKTTDKELSELKLKTSSGNTIKIYDENDYKSKNKVDSNDIKAEEKYYAKTSSTKIKVDIEGVDDDYVRVFADKKNSTKGVKIGKTVILSGGTNTITVRIYDEKPNSNVKYKDDDNVTNDYVIKVKCTSSDDKDDDDYDKDYDDVYLKNLTLSEGEINFYKRTTKYDVYLESSVNKITIKAKPEDEDYKIKIDGYRVDDDDNYKDEVSLVEGKNTIEIEVEDEYEDDYRIYTLNIYRGGKNSTSDKITSMNNGYTGCNELTSTVSIITNNWVEINGKWKYVDSFGIPLTNIWFYDNNLKNYYYLKADGSMATGWQYIGNEWYCLGSNGVRLTGWQYINGKWYYMYSTGVMAKDTTIGYCRLDSSGAWIK